MKQRGKHPKDESLFEIRQHQTLRQAAGELQWLLSRGYALAASLQLVGDRYQLRDRQRLAIGRAVASEQQLASRYTRQLRIEQLTGQEVWIDTLNTLLTLEAFLGGGVLLRCQDQTMRDMSSVHGTYRRVEQTEAVIAATVSWFHDRLQVQSLRWLIDSPVSNSGRLKEMIQSQYIRRINDCSTVELVPDPDVLLSGCQFVVVSTDSVILDKCSNWSNAAAEIIDTAGSPLDDCPRAVDPPIIVQF